MATAPLITVPDALRPVSFHGEEIARAGWDIDDPARPPQWTDMILYRVDHTSDSEYQYVLQVVGRSVVYHDGRKGCRNTKGAPRGMRTTVGELESSERYEILEPCAKCAPQDLMDLTVDTAVRAEQDWFRAHICRNVEDLFTALRDRSRGTDHGISGLGMFLLHSARRQDAAIDAAMTTPRHL